MKNLLPDQNDTKEYKKWMETKSLNSLKRVLSIYKLDLKMSTNKYTNVKTRIHLITTEIEKREFLRLPDTLEQKESDMNSMIKVCEALF